MSVDEVGTYDDFGTVWLILLTGHLPCYKLAFKSSTTRNKIEV